MGTMPIHWGGPSGLPLTMLAQAIPMLSRCDLEALTERLIDHLDQIDGDPDLEEDDPAGQIDEDGFNTCLGTVSQMIGPGCMLSDDDHSDADNYLRYGNKRKQPPRRHRGRYA